MFIHIGSRRTVSGRQCVGIFNVDSLGHSNENDHILSTLNPDVETVLIMDDGRVEMSSISSATIIKRVAEDSDDYIWRRQDDKNLQR